MPPTQRSTRIKACLSCQKHKVRCTARNRTGPCQRCERRNIECVRQKQISYRCSSDEDSTLANVLADMRMLHAAINNILARKPQPILGPLKSTVADPASQEHSPSGPPQEIDSIEDDPQEIEPEDIGPDGIGAEDEIEAQEDSNQDISTEGKDSIEPLNQIPIKSLYEVTQLGSLQLSPSRLTNETPGSAHVLPDLVSEGKLEWHDADRLITRFLNETDHYLYDISTRFKGTETIRRASPLLFTAICTVSALHEPRGEALFQVCNLELRRLISDFVFATKVTLDDFQGLCIASFWLSDSSWSVSGLAIRRAFEFHLGRSFEIVVGEKSVPERPAAKMRFRSKEDALDCLRVWYLFFICDHHMSILYGRPSSFGVQSTVNEWERYLKANPESSTEIRIASQIELLLLLEKVTQLLGPNVNTRTPLIFKPQIELLDQQLDQWIATWTSRYESHEQIGEFPHKALTLHYFFAKLFLSSHVFRGLTPNTTRSPIPKEFRDMAQSAVRSARSIIELVTQDNAMKAAFVAIPHYYHTFVAYACSFLLKVQTEYHNHLGLQRQELFHTTNHFIELCLQSECASFHLVRWMGAGLKRLASNCETALSRQYGDGQHGPGQNETFEIDPNAESFIHPTDQEMGGSDRALLPVEGGMSFPADFISDPTQGIDENMDYMGNISATDTGFIDQQEWGSLYPVFSSEYMGFGLL